MTTVRRRPQAARRERKVSFGPYVEWAPAGVFVIDQEGRIVHSNRAAMDLSGYDDATLKTMYIWDIHPAEERDGLLRARAVLSDKGRVHMEARLRRRDGRTIWVSMRLLRIENDLSLGYYLDITDRKQAEEVLKETEETSRLLFERSVNPLFLVDHGVFVDCNEAALKLMHCSRKEELIGLGPLDVSPERQPDGRLSSEKQQELDRITLEEGSNHYECVRRRLDGEEFWVDVSVTLVPIHGRLTAHAVWTDISERKEAEARLKESEERYRNIFENASEGIYQITPEFTLLSVNPALARMHGYDSPEEMVEAVGANGMSLCVHEDDRKLYCDLLREHGLVRGLEAEQYRKDGSRYRALVNARVVRDGQGKILCYEGVVEDITERRRLEDQLRQTNKLEAVGTLAGGVAHDFNNRLTVISCFGTLLQAAIDNDSPLRPYVDEIMTASEKAANLTKSLLAFSRKQRMDLGPQNLNEIVASTGKLLRRLLPEDIEVRLKLSDADTTVMVDVAQIDQVLMNLATNARDAMTRGGTLTIETSIISQVGELLFGAGAMRPGRYVVLSISDTGIGMDEATRKRIFDPFFTTKEVGKGTGLGLSSVYGIVQQHQGYITVSTAIARGTTFRVYLPLMEGEARAAEPSLARSKGGTETLLIAEDDPEVRRLLNHVLRTFGYTTMEAKDGEEAIRTFRENQDKVDLLLLDVVMPRKNGKEVLEEIRKSRPDTRAIFVSGYTGDIIFEKGLRSETVDFVPKPLSTMQLLGKVREVLDR